MCSMNDVAAKIGNKVAGLSVSLNTGIISKGVLVT
jgi:hypothetical protein